MDRQPILEGDRLQLRPLRADDWAALYAVASDPLIWEVHPSHDRWQEPLFRTFFDDALAKGGALEKIGGRLSDRIELAETTGGMVRQVVYEITRASFAAGPLA